MAEFRDKAIEDELDSLFDLEMNDLLAETGDKNDESVYEEDRKPVDIIQFIEDPYYLGGQVQLQPAVKDILWDIEDPEVREADLQIGKGSGKSEICGILQCYGGYLATWLKNPQKFYGLSTSTIIASINVSIGRDQARDIVFQSVKFKTEESPYFQKIGFQTLTTSIKLPKNVRIYCGHSGDKAFLGYGTIRGVMDEVNYMYDNKNRNVAEDLYHALHGSMKTRYPDKYKLIAVSSMTLPSTWLNQRAMQAERDGSDYIRRAKVQVKTIQDLADCTLVRVSCEVKPSDEELSRGLLADHGLVIKAHHTGWVAQDDGSWAITAEVQRQVLPGL